MREVFKSNTFKFTVFGILIFLLSFVIIGFSVNGFGYIVNGHQGATVTHVHLWIKRLKVAIMALFSGGALAVAGVMLQKVTRNNLSDVSILGIGSMNIMFITGYVLIFKDKVFAGGVAEQMLPIVTLFASLLGTFIVWFFSRSKKGSSNKFIIVGIALQLLFEALAVVLIDPTKTSKDPHQAKIIATIKDYTVGMINADTKWWLVIVSSSLIAIVITIIFFLRNKIDVLEANEHLAYSLGIKVERMKGLIYVLVAILAASEAVMVGTVALLGIIGPALARMLFKNKTGLLIFASFSIGGIMVMIATVISLTIGTQLPIGILATAIIIPYFIYVIVRSK